MRSVWEGLRRGKTNEILNKSRSFADKSQSHADRIVQECPEGDHPYPPGNEAEG
jgi:hypothetical protein